MTLSSVSAMAIIINLTCAAIYALLVWRLRREIRRAGVLNRLLMRIAIDSFARDHQPMWRAWAQSMGTISIEVHGDSWDGEPPRATPSSAAERAAVPPARSPR